MKGVAPEARNFGRRTHRSPNLPDHGALWDISIKFHPNFCVLIFIYRYSKVSVASVVSARQMLEEDAYALEERHGTAGYFHSLAANDTRVVVTSTTSIDLIGTRDKPPWELNLFSIPNKSNTVIQSHDEPSGLPTGLLSTAAPVPASGDNPYPLNCVTRLDNSGRLVNAVTTQQTYHARYWIQPLEALGIIGISSSHWRLDGLGESGNIYENCTLAQVLRLGIVWKISIWYHSIEGLGRGIAILQLGMHLPQAGMLLIGTGSPQRLWIKSSRRSWFSYIYLRSRSCRRQHCLF